MSSTVSQEARALLTELLAAEKDDTRAWLRAEMDRLVDPMLDSMFLRLETKLTNGTINQIEEGDQLGEDGGCAQFSNSFSQIESLNVQVQQPFVPILMPEPSTTFTSYLDPTLSYLNPEHVNMDYSLPFDLHSTVPCLPVSISNVKSHPIKQEIEATANKPQNEIAKDYSSQSLSAPIENEQSNRNFANSDEEDEDCDCDDCVNGVEEIKQEEEEDDRDSIEWVEEEEERDESSRLVKRPRLDTTQPEITEQCSRQATPQPNQVNNHDGKIITISLECPHSDCLDTFPEDQLNDHMSVKHDGPFQCLVRDCRASFDNRSILRNHIKHVHQHTSQWHCAKCAKHFITHKQLYNHNIDLHKLGNFQCSFPACTFTAEYRRKVFNHYTAQHKQTLTCQYPDCNFRISNALQLKRHERTHLGIKPYRCKWPNCVYAGTNKSNALTHIRNVHLALNPNGAVLNGTQLYDPNDYVEVVHDLLG